MMVETLGFTRCSIALEVLRIDVSMQRQIDSTLKYLPPLKSHARICMMVGTLDRSKHRLPQLLKRESQEHLTSTALVV